MTDSADKGRKEEGRGREGNATGWLSKGTAETKAWREHSEKIGYHPSGCSVLIESENSK